ncbi:hypothetical protein SKAU_G00147470 [Synaphobranchus kaupii]|uniref:PBZ-type domain-containing protein n=1 Tax=Synaphobranchus kaupii TaxID=118154 RepID=A0A9Q1J4K8_SYNKA|nr:hypothetical protein SKAU_G00147470 [Synaphobranchus kaupii]
MSDFELEPVDGGISIQLPEGEIQLGRGPFLGVNDKRVSRHHGLLENANGQLRIKPTHQNPCFYQPSLGDPPEALEKDRWHPLRPGNLFSLLPAKYVYRVVSVNCTQSNSQAFEEEEPITDEPPASSKPDEEPLRSPELNGQSEQNHTQNQQVPTRHPHPTASTCSREKEEDKTQAAAPKEQESGSREPEQRKRVLPAWMMQIAPDVSSPSTSTAGVRKRGRGKAPPTQAKQPRPRKARNRSVSSEESEQSEVEQTPKKRAKRLKSEEDEEEEIQPKARSEAETTGRPAGTGNDESGEASGSADRGSGVEKGEGQRNGGHAPKARPPEGRRRAEVKDGGEKESQSQDREREVGGQEGDGAEGEASAARVGPSQAKAKTPPRPPCPYGKECYRKNPVHFKECSHPGDSDYAEGDDDDELDKEEDDNRPECPYGTSCYRKNPQHKKEYKHTQDPGKKTRLDDDDDDEGDEDAWDNDSFINDDSGDLEEDSDYVPPESEDEDVQRLKTEAKAFLKRKR